MDKFLRQLAEHIRDTSGDETRDLCVVLPNRRAGVFLKKQLSATYRKSIWAPAVYAIEDFIIEHTPYRQAEPAVMLFELYNVHKEVAPPGKAQSFEEVMSWGTILLEDLNEIDLYLADAPQIFTYLEEEKAISLWHPDGSPLTDMEKEYFSFFRSLGTYYDLLRERLSRKKLSYQGMAYRYFIDHIAEIAPRLGWKKIIFAGFNALTLAEETIIRNLGDRGLAEVLWDADRYYLDDKNQEAGEFLRSYFSTWSSGNQKWTGDELTTEAKKIQITGVAGNTGQVKYAGQLLADMDMNEETAENTAVVLADEGLLIPMLNSIPPGFSDVNITMGYPISLTPLFLFMQSVIDMHENAEKRSLMQKGERRLYGRDLIRVISHPYFRFLSRQDESEITTMKGHLLRSNKVYYLPGEIREIFSGFPEGLTDVMFSPWKDPQAALGNLSVLVDNLRDRILELRTGNSEDLRLETEYLFHYAKLIRKLKDLTDEYGHVDNLRTLRKLMETVGKSGRIPFVGEPLKGLQVMGVLETRTLDFENIILLSANENIIPAPRNYQSFIPFEIKRHFRLPTFRDKDAIYAYHFYRMLQKAGNINILYNSEPQTLSGGERSRFITQLITELPKANPSASIEERILHAPPVLENLVPELSVPKNKEVMSVLVEKAAKGFSPSSLASYIHCPLQFYLKSIAGLEEEEDLEETVDAATLGSVVHSALQWLYGDRRKKLISREDLTEMQKEVPSSVEQAFREHYEGGDIRHGKNLLISRVASLFVTRLIRMEADSLDHGENIEILLLEKELLHSLPAEINGTQMDITIRGKIDRADRVNGQVRIIDYKTGAVKSTELEIKDWEEIITDPGLSKAFQLMTYALLYRQAREMPVLNSLPGIISLRMPSKGFMQVSTPGSSHEESIEMFSRQLELLFRQIFDPATSFSQTEDPERCKYCPFRSLCQR